MAALQLFTLLAIASLSASSLVKAPDSENGAKNKDGGFELLILHNNDMHARFEQTSQLSGACNTADREAGKCYGGFPRVAYVVKEARRAAASGEGPPVLYLNAGDTYTGTAWFTIYKWKIAAEFVNALQPDAVSLGNNEFEAESSRLSPFLENLEPSVLASNIILKSDKENQKIQKSVTFDVQGVKVGVIGFLTPESKILDSVGNIEYIDEVLAVREEVEKLQVEGVNFLIALGHSINGKDIEVAKEVEGIDIVISGHKNIYFGNATTTDENDDTILVTQSSGRLVPVVQSKTYSKYLGKVMINIDNNGEILGYDSQPITLENTMPQDTEIISILNKYRNDISMTNEEVVGQTAVVLDGTSCSYKECNLGNFIADAMVFYNAITYESEVWTDVSIAVINGGAIAGSIAPVNRPASITRGDVLAVLPSESNIVRVTLSGTQLEEFLEQVVTGYNHTNPTGEFLQFSGIRVVYDLEKEPGSRVVSAVVRCWSCFVPEYYVIDDWRSYNVLMPAAMADGGYGYSLLVDLPRVNMDYDEVTSVISHIQLRSPVYPEESNRITLLNLDSIQQPELEPELEPEVDELDVPDAIDIGETDSAVALSATFMVLFTVSIALIFA